MSSAEEKYRAQLEQLRAIRLKNKNSDSQEEDDLLCEMDRTWQELTDEERMKLNNEV